MLPQGHLLPGGGGARDEGGGARDEGGENKWKRYRMKQVKTYSRSFFKALLISSFSLVNCST